MSGALVLIWLPYAMIPVGELTISMSTVGGASALIISAVLAICAGSMWLRPEFRLPAGITTILLALVALVTVNLGSFFIGTALALVGGSLAVAWTTGGTQRSSNPPSPQAPASTDEEHE